MALRRPNTLTTGALFTAAVLGITAADAHLRPGDGQVKASVSAPVSVTATQPAPQPDVESLNALFTGIAERMSPTVVSIYTRAGGPGPGGLPGRRDFSGDEFEHYFRHPFDREDSRGGEALGSGFVIDQEGHIVTNAHVVRMAGRNAGQVMVKLKGEDRGKGHRAKVIGVDELTDVAVLKLEDKVAALQPATLGDSDASKAGEWVVAIGNPYGHTHTITQGILSAVGRSLEGARADFLQTSASINPGNSGGPLFNMKGEVIGINTAIDARAQGIGFAIPINTAKNVISELQSKGRVTRAWMGIGIQDLNEDIAGYMGLKSMDGVLVEGVAADGPAGRAGIRRFDIIRKVNGKETPSSRELLKEIDALKVGQAAEVVVLREGRERTLNVKVSERPSEL